MFAKILMAAAVLLAGTAQAHDYTLGSLKINHPWARATVAGAAAGGGFLKITNSGAADRLISAQAEVSNAVELHTMVMEGNTMRMRKLDKGIELPAGQSVELKPGGLHIMFIELKAPLKQGDKFPLKLSFEKAGEITVDVQIEAVGAAAAPAMQHAH
ncbi:copper chaperone PCu(A)C [Uliginosibacterium sp. 31-16]|uniref:copper chaperone PCu(A)C n=1 Tax=Uliginosibacterium sp. 31-16 TaxID=3068315 RepID=UPI00273F7A2F|nr:copper chaperone PCu(A)C [Uliginosibacterium sp. 31-16]MDP5241389.1 copper chaperone PCu(A)C [Uliginosibacterium sp. 31-16]